MGIPIENLHNEDYKSFLNSALKVQGLVRKEKIDHGYKFDTFYTAIETRSVFPWMRKQVALLEENFPSIAIRVSRPEYFSRLQDVAKACTRMCNLSIQINCD